jgi:serine/threonine protein kinase
MEGSLAHLLESDLIISDSTVLDLIRAIARGLHVNFQLEKFNLKHLHLENLIHRDLACRNILYTETKDGYVPKIGEISVKFRRILSGFWSDEINCRFRTEKCHKIKNWTCQNYGKFKKKWRFRLMAEIIKILDFDEISQETQDTNLEMEIIDRKSFMTETSSEEKVIQSNVQ